MGKWSEEKKALLDRKYNAKRELKAADQTLEEAAKQGGKQKHTAKKAQTRAMTQAAWAGREVEESGEAFKAFRKEENNSRLEQGLTALVDAFTGGAVSIRNRTDQLLENVPNPDRIQPLIDKAHADAQGYMDAALDDNKHLEGGAMPAPPKPGAAGNTAGAAQGGRRVDTSPMMINDRGYRSLDGMTALGANGRASNAQIAAAEAQTRQIEYDRKRQEYDDALTLKLQSMEFEARSRAAQLAADMKEASPENQRIKAGAFIESLLSSPATSPMAAVDPREKAARYKILNGVQQHLLSEVQRNSMERQKSQALADMGTRTAAVIKNARDGVYESDPLKAYADVAGGINAAAKYMSPQQYNAQVIEAYDGLAEAMAEAGMKTAFKFYADKPVLNVPDMGLWIKDLSGYEAGAVRMGALLGGGDGVALLTDRAGLISEKVGKTLQDYNRGLLDKNETRRVTALEEGDIAAARTVSAEWLPLMREMAEKGDISSRDAYATRNYFGAPAEEGGGGADGKSAAALAKQYLPKVQDWASDGVSGMSPAEAINALTADIMTAAGWDDVTLPPLPADAGGEEKKRYEAAEKALSEQAKKARYRAKNTAMETLFNAWSKSTDFKNSDIVLSSYHAVMDNVEEALKPKGKLEKTGSPAAEKAAWDVFWNGVYNIPTNAGRSEVNDRMRVLTTNFVDDLAVVLDTGADDRTYEEARNNPDAASMSVKDMEKTYKKYIEFGKNTGADVSALADNAGTDAKYHNFINKVRAMAAEAFDEGRGDYEGYIMVSHDVNGGRFIISRFDNNGYAGMYEFGNNGPGGAMYLRPIHRDGSLKRPAPDSFILGYVYNKKQDRFVEHKFRYQDEVNDA